MVASLDFTFDPLDPKLLLIHSIWYLIAAGLLVGAFRSKGEWLKASLGAMGLAILGIQTLAVLPSWWLYFADTKLDWGGQGCTAFDLQCAKQVIKDSVVVVENAVALGAFVVGFIIWQRKYPKQLASGESKPETTGGYR